MRKIAMSLSIAGYLGLACLQAGSAAAHEAESDADDFRLLQLSDHYVKWGEPTLGSGAIVTYAFVDAPVRFNGARNCRSMVPMNELKRRSSISQATLEKETAAAFRIWERAANVSFIAIDDPAEADILIGAQGKPVRRAFANVSYRPGSGNGGVKAIDRALICLNPQRPWKVGFDGDTDVYDIRYTLAHEIGHAIGLNHPGPSGQIMSFRYSERFRELQPGDLRGVALLYGDGTERLAAADLPAPDDAETEQDEYSLD